jgi:hypothetical protein
MACCSLEERAEKRGIQEDVSSSALPEWPLAANLMMRPTGVSNVSDSGSLVKQKNNAALANYRYDPLGRHQILLCMMGSCFFVEG